MLTKILEAGMSVKSLAVDDERRVDVSVKFYRIGEIDIMNERYFAELKLKLFWLDNTVDGEYDAKKHWNPRIVIENAFSKSDEQVDYEVVEVCEGSRGVLETRRIKVTEF
jgi:hypothetical protein